MSDIFTSEQRGRERGGEIERESEREKEREMYCCVSVKRIRRLAETPACNGELCHLLLLPVPDS